MSLLNSNKTVRLRLNMLKNQKVLRGIFDGSFLDLRAIAREFGDVFTFGDQTEPQVVDGYVEIFYEIGCTNWAEYLFPFMRRFTQIVANNSPPTHNNPILSISTNRVFENKLIPQQKNIHLKAIWFGNFINRGLLMAHWEISYYMDDKEHVPQRFVNAEFTHDENFAVFRFQVFEKKALKENNATGKDLNHYALKMYYKHVKRCVIDLAATDSSTGTKKEVFRIHFVVLAPVQIFRQREAHMKQRSENGQANYGDGERQKIIYRGRYHFEKPCVKAFADSPVFSIEFEKRDLVLIYNIISRMMNHNGMQVEFGSIPMCYGLLSFKNEDSTKKLDFNDNADLVYIATQTERWTDYMIARLKIPHHVDLDAKKEMIFPILYLIEGLISRGAVVKDQILLTDEHYQAFLDVVLDEYCKNAMRAEWALEELMGAIDEQKEIISITKAFQKFANAPKDIQEEAEREQISEGYVKCRKIVVTPTRRIYIVPETMMGNRVIRQKSADGNQIIRVSFRDDDNTQMRRITTSEFLLKQTVEDAMARGIKIGSFKYIYLGNSNSQMRDHGCYFLRGERQDAERVRNSLGKFGKLPNVPKVVARLGQCFTQSRESNTHLAREDYETMHDYIGGQDSSGKEYTFSDGVGRVSVEFMKEVAQKLRLGKDFVPSCVQFRFRGGKGVLTQDPVLDEDIFFTRKLGFLSETGFVDPVLYKDPMRKKLHKVVFRDSQMKFQAPRSSEMEIVKYSAPTPVSLNRPWINILDQVADMQSHDAHQRVSNRIEELLDRHLRNTSLVLIEEKACRDKLKEMPHRFDIDLLAVNCGFQLSVEPFFRSLVKAAVKYTLMRQLHKEQIPIPFDQGRSMFGVVDETGLLQYDQIFVQYTVNMALKTPGKNAATRVLKGRTLVTKNPCIVAGDVRILNAVDLPQLRHLKDVIVFPRHGPRPHPDEMAGSDLDGDEYSVVWDPLLMFDHNEPPMDFTKASSLQQHVKAEHLTDEVIKYFIDYMKLDQVGMVATAFLVNSDLHGIDSEVAKQVAQKHSEAVDFPKTGQPPDKLTTSWNEKILEDGTKIQVPPEKAPRQPDFLEKDHEPTYVSTRMVGKIYREVKTIQDILLFSEEMDSQLQFDIDPDIEFDGWEDYRPQAEADYANYVATLRREMEHYGIKSESEILTGFILEQRNKLSDKDNDDMSFFNTSHTIEKKVTAIWIACRKHFFEGVNSNTNTKFDDYTSATKLYDKAFVDQENPLHRYSATPTGEMMKKAVAYYKVCYEKAARTTAQEGRILSFPWLVWDVLRGVKQEKLNLDVCASLLGKSPFFVSMDRHIDTYCEENREKMDKILLELMSTRAVNVYCKIYDGRKKWCRNGEVFDEDEDEIGLSELLFIVCEWAEKMNIIDFRLKRIHLALLFIQFSTQMLKGSKEMYIEKINLSRSAEDLVDTKDIVERCGHRRVRDPGMIFTYFLQFLGSRLFRKRSELSFVDLGMNSMFFDDEWMPIHDAARSTYYNMVFSSRFDELPTQEVVEREIFPALIREDPGFTIELPPEMDQDDTLRQKLIDKCGLKELDWRRKTGSAERANRVRVSAMGTIRSLKKLRNLLYVKPIAKNLNQGPDIDRMYANMVYEKIMKDDIEETTT